MLSHVEALIRSFSLSNSRMISSSSVLRELLQNKIGPKITTTAQVILDKRFIYMFFSNNKIHILWKSEFSPKLHSP